MRLENDHSNQHDRNIFILIGKYIKLYWKELVLGIGGFAILGGLVYLLSQPIQLPTFIHHTSSQAGEQTGTEETSTTDTITQTDTEEQKNLQQQYLDSSFNQTAGIIESTRSTILSQSQNVYVSTSTEGSSSSASESSTYETPAEVVDDTPSEPVDEPTSEPSSDDTPAEPQEPEEPAPEPIPEG